MKRLILLIVILVLVSLFPCECKVEYYYDAPPTPTPNLVDEPQMEEIVDEPQEQELIYTEPIYVEKNVVQQTQNAENNVANIAQNRLYIPSVDIDVAIYGDGGDAWSRQSIVDRADSACEFNYWTENGCATVIGDHSNQDFYNLPSVQIGDSAYISNPDGSITELVCTNVTNGINTGWDIIADDGTILADSAYTIYTCCDGGIIICTFDKVA